MASDDPKFICPACGKQYRWKPELAGRSAKCACGGKLVVPAEPPGANNTLAPTPSPVAASVRSPDALAASVKTGPAPATPPLPPRPVAGGTACPSCKASLAPGAVLCVACGYNLKTGKKLSLVVEVDEDDADESPDDAAPAPAKGAKDTG